VFCCRKTFFLSLSMTFSQSKLECLSRRDKTRVQMPAKLFPHWKLLFWLIMGPTLGSDTKQSDSFLTKFGVFLQ
jgi:hypothetical protein